MSVGWGTAGGAPAYATSPAVGEVSPTHVLGASAAGFAATSANGAVALTWHWVQFENGACGTRLALRSPSVKPSEWQARHSAALLARTGCGITGGAPSKARRIARSRTAVSTDPPTASSPTASSPAAAFAAFAAIAFDSCHPEAAIPPVQGRRSSSAWVRAGGTTPGSARSRCGG
jgi:hypothetical protein